MNRGNHDVDDDGMETESGDSGVGKVGFPNSSPMGSKLCTAGDTTPVTGVKRKVDITLPTHTAEGSGNQVEAGLACIKSLLKTAMNEARQGGEKPGSSRLIKILENIFDVVAPMLTKKGKLRSPLLPPAKKSRDDLAIGPEVRGIDRPEMVDAGTDTILTPNWWESEQERRKKESTRRRTRKAGACGRTEMTTHTDDGAESAMETDGEGWKEVVGRKTTSAPPNGRMVGQHIPLRTGAKHRAKPPAVLVKLAAGSSYADTVRAIRQNSEINLAELGAQVTGMRKTRDGQLLVELGKGAGSVVAAQKLSSAIATRLGDAVGGVSQLSQYAVVEIVDLDAVATKDEVLSALRAAIPGPEDDQAAICERQAMQITGLWPTRSGQQIATARMTRAAASSISRVPIGWTMCRVRPRRSEPEKCFRCHGFGHQSGNCPGPDLSSNCKRCGELGHELKQCLASKDLCVACERAGIVRYEHKPGSGMCKARKEALKKSTEHNIQTKSRQVGSGDGASTLQ